MIKILDSDNGKFYFNVLADNGEVVATSQMYTKKDKAVQMAKSFANIDFEIGDFTVRKKPTKKAGS